MNQPGKPLTDEQQFCLEGCRSYPQYYKMRTDFESGYCTFCSLDRELNHVLWEDEHVVLWHVPLEFMRTGLAQHWLIAPKRHVRFESDLSIEEYVSVFMAKKVAYELFDYRGGLTHVREGDMRLNSGTVPHLHYNTFVPSQSAEVHIPVFKDPKSRTENQARAAEFSVRYESGEKP